jgi:hypothetical protein
MDEKKGFLSFNTKAGKNLSWLSFFAPPLRIFIDTVPPQNAGIRRAAGVLQSPAIQYKNHLTH